jgi:hypothetical protein
MMQYDFEHVAMELPRALADETAYVFEDKRRGTSLIVSTEPPHDGVAPALVLGELIEQLRGGYRDECAVLAERDTTFLGSPARAAALRLGPAGQELSMHMLAAVGAHGVTLIKLISGGAGDHAAQFDPIVRSAAPASEPWTRAGAPGTTRRQAGPFTLEVPSSLAPPASFSFASADLSAKLGVQYKTGPLGQEIPPFDQIIYLSDPAKETLDVEAHEDRPIQVAGHRGWDGAWSLVRRVDGREAGRYVIRRLSLPIRPDLSLEMLGVATSSGVEALGSAWSGALRTMRRGAT